jgi:NhaA family Na+:H+ antiporter
MAPSGMNKDDTPRPRSFSIRQFFQLEASGGILLMFVAALAIIVANSPAAPFYFAGLASYMGGLSLLHWINDGLMALFFLLVGLEIKRELVSGQMATWSARALPGFGAIGGMLVPALFYLAVNQGEGGAVRGWAIPAATDIAFALGVLSLLGSRVPISLKIFLATLAILDDLGAVLIIAVFYAGDLNLMALMGAAVVSAVLVILNHFGIKRLLPYLVLGAVLWVLMLQSGVHPTLAGVILAFTIPLRVKTAQHEQTPLHVLEQRLHPWITFFVVPVFGFANAGVSLFGIPMNHLLDPVPLGVALGLFFGKQIGVFSFAFIAIRLKLAKLPGGANWVQFYGVSTLCGIGFTMSLFIGLLAFADSPLLQAETKLGVLIGSLLSALLGAFLLRVSSKQEA